ncbi:MAG: hypothetical protein Ct9H90mP18_03550 [Gammaproteobacteria bacterium]|nr:MAG: hypothetical protein Ct9H90mP18_03550 [Gammaproteobacteria bacterium]
MINDVSSGSDDMMFDISKTITLKSYLLICPRALMEKKMNSVNIINDLTNYFDRKSIML